LSGTAVLWFRRDLRLSDHPALLDACHRFDRVVPLFVWDPALVRPAGAARSAFLAGCVADLADSLGGRLVVRRGRPVAAVTTVARSCRATEVLVSADFGPYGSRRDDQVAQALAADGRRLTRVGSPYAVDPGTLLTSAGRPFQVFTPFSRAWHERGWDRPKRRPDLSRLTSGAIKSHSGPAVPAVTARLPEPGERAARRRLDAFVRSGLRGYAKEHDRPDRPATSMLSAYLRFGCIHPRQVLARLRSEDPDHDRFAAELCWREFHADVLHHRPDAARQPYRQEWRSMQVDEGPRADDRFGAWTEGRTGYPIVDAGMRQLLGLGWMHNRVRMIAASFLVKDLHIDWTRGARWFMEHLVDADLASNQLNWQWVAGSGTDAAPYFRVFNPVTQGQKFDPEGRYIRRWVPELAALAIEDVHQPSKSRATGGSYPVPIVDHAAEREEALVRYSRMRATRGDPGGHPRTAAPGDPP
jgi:deoxyribodipyrimidine photo-lyase